MSNVKKVGSVTLSVSSALPTTYDSNAVTGYASLTFTDVAEVIDIGEISKTFEVITHQTVEKDHPEKLKGNYDIADVAINLGRVITDAGQVLINSALSSASSYAFKVNIGALGEAFYFTAKVTKAGVAAISSGAIASTAVTLAIDPQSLFQE